MTEIPVVYPFGEIIVLRIGKGKIRFVPKWIRVYDKTRN